MWAIGLIAVHLLTGEIYGTANSVAELMVHILAEPLYRPTQRWPWLPSGIDDWFARSCAREPAHRFRGVGEQVDALGEALGLRGAAFASTFQAQAPVLAQAPPRPMPMPLAAPPPPRSAPTMPLPGAATTNHPHALSTTGASAAPRSRAAPIVLAVLGMTLLGGLGGTAWVMRGRVVGHDTPSTPVPTVITAAAAPMAPLPSLSNVALVVPPAASSVASVSSPPDPPASASARPTVRPPPWRPSQQGVVPAATPHPTTFAPVSP